MNLKLTSRSIPICVMCILPLAIALLAAAVLAQQNGDKTLHVPIVHPLANANFASDRDPACLSSAVEVGDPDSGPSTILIKEEPGCVVRWHFHSAEQQMMVIKGELKAEMSTVPATVLGPGGFILIPSKEKHQFTCASKSECLFFLTIEGRFDNQWVNPGN
jgi:quercetin dioxygenase-like cupin family protein